MVKNKWIWIWMKKKSLESACLLKLELNRKGFEYIWALSVQSIASHWIKIVCQLPNPSLEKDQQLVQMIYQLFLTLSLFDRLIGVPKISMWNYLLCDCDQRSVAVMI